MKLKKALKTMPKSVRVGPYTMKIKLSKGPLLKGDGSTDEYVGLCDVAAETIHIGQIEDKITPRFAAGVVLHEILHALHRSQVLRRNMKEEELVSNLEIGLLGFIAENPKFMKWFQNAVR